MWDSEVIVDINALLVTPVWFCAGIPLRTYNFTDSALPSLYYLENYK